MRQEPPRARELFRLKWTRDQERREHAQMRRVFLIERPPPAIRRFAAYSSSP
jgi:uncharacterized protein (DUF2236 family)